MDDMKEYGVGAAAFEEPVNEPPRRRPIYVWLVLVIAIAWVVAETMHYVGLVDHGLISVLAFLGLLAVPLSMLAGSIALVLMRKAAIWLLLVHALLAVLRLVLGLNPSGLLLTAIVLAYAFSLRSQGRLR